MVKPASLEWKFCNTAIHKNVAVAPVDKPIRDTVTFSFGRGRRWVLCTLHSQLASAGMVTMSFSVLTSWKWSLFVRSSEHKLIAISVALKLANKTLTFLEVIIFSLFISDKNGFEYIPSKGN